MPRSDEAEWWFNAVYEAVQEIPHGKVTSYGEYTPERHYSSFHNAHSETYLGHIARLLGKRKLFKWNTLCRSVLTRSSFAAECPRFVVMLNIGSHST